MSAGPLRTVLTAFEEGAGSRAEVVARTRLTPGVVDAAIEHLVRMGRMTADELRLGCPDGGCTGCVSGTRGERGCPTGPRGPVLVDLRVRRPGAR